MPAGTSAGGQFAKADGSVTSQTTTQQEQLTTIVQGKEVPVGLRDKKNWESHTTAEQRSDPTFQTSFSDGLIAKQGTAKPTTVKPEPKKEEPKPVEPTPEIKLPEPTPPEVRPQGANYRVEAMKDKLEKHIGTLKEQKQQMIDKYGNDEVYVERVNKALTQAISQLDNLEANDKKLGLPHIPMGKNTHTKETKGFVHGGKSTIKIDPRLKGNMSLTQQLTVLQSAWNNLPDDVRDNIKILNVKASTAQGRVIQGGRWRESTGEVIVNINARQDGVIHDFYHEVGHSKWSKMRKTNPEKVTKFIEMQKEIGTAPTKYSQSYVMIQQRTEQKIQRFIQQRKRLGLPIGAKNEKTMENNRKTVQDLYQNEIHSELNAFIMGEVPERLITTSKKNMTALMNAYKELHGL